MNRLDEYNNLIQELEDSCSEAEYQLEQTLKRVQKRTLLRKRIIRPIATLAAVFALFIALVNFCTPVAQACSKVPFLRELAEAVTFSPSLADAVENEYAQEIGLSQTDNDITAMVEYLIVDQKQVNVFFRLESDVYDSMGVYPKVLAADGDNPPPCSYGLNDWDVPNGELQSVTIDFIEEDVPDTLRLELQIENTGEDEETEDGSLAEEISDWMFEEESHEDPEYIAEFDFVLTFIPGFTASGKIYEMNQTIELEGQKITIENVEVYPSHLRVNISDHAENTAWIKQLHFYIETDQGKTFDKISNGITATGTGASKSMTSFRAESSYFYEADELKLVITGAEWLNKDMEKVYINLKTGETGTLPEGVTLYKATEEAGGWILDFLAEQRRENYTHQVFGHSYYDSEGNEYEINSWSSGGVPVGEENKECFLETFPLKGYHENEVWLTPYYSHVWTADEPVVIIIN